MKKNYDNAVNGAVATGCLTIMLMLVFMPIITYWFGYFGGWILMNFVGNSMVNVINTIFGRQAVEVNSLPVFFGGLAVVASYFKSKQTNNNNK